MISLLTDTIFYSIFYSIDEYPVYSLKYRVPWWNKEIRVIIEKKTKSSKNFNQPKSRETLFFSKNLEFALDSLLTNTIKLHGYHSYPKLTLKLITKIPGTESGH